ncbi:MAG: serine/threonine protein kinase [Planctomycetota bacterium]|nr:MAG: serine/threonine protein kinase [Planctomycetota bacterium]
MKSRPPLRGLQFDLKYPEDLLIETSLSVSTPDTRCGLDERSTRLAWSELVLGPVLGAGTVGTVYAARWRGQPVAVKMLHPTLCADPLIRARFRREMEILSRLNHPHIVRYFGGGEREGQLFYAMEIMAWGNLRQLIQRHGRLHWQEVASVGCQIAAALQHAHNHGIVHRDVKPSNIFLQENGAVKLGDFGIARDVHAADLTGPGITVGTHGYMAPEQIRGSSRLTGQADLYSLGCVLFELLTGHPPFEAPDLDRVLEMHLRKDPPALTDAVGEAAVVSCPSELAELIHHMLAKQPSERPFNARAVQGRLVRLLCESAASTAISGAVSVQPTADNPGMQRLAQRIATQTRPDVSWPKLALLAAVAVAIILLVRWMSQ